MHFLRFLPAIFVFFLLPTLVVSAAPLAHVEVVVDGQGTVEPESGVYEIGTRLVFKAHPGAGLVFGDWTDAVGTLFSPERNGMDLEYTVLGDAQIVAHFVPSPFVASSTAWTAWLRTFDFATSGRPVSTARGYAAINLSRTGAFTGKLKFDAETFVLTGTFDALGRTALSFSRPGRRPLRVVLRVQIEQPQERLSLAVYDGESCAMASVSTRAAPELTACYTVSLGIVGRDARKGYAILKRTADGAFRGVGSLDGTTAFSFEAQPGIDHFTGGTSLPVDAQLGNGEFLSGLILFQETAPPAAGLSAKLQWIVPTPPVLSGAGAANSVFVGPFGADTNAGTVDSPLATLDNALAHIGGEGEIVMLPGSYEHASLNLATAGKVTLRAAHGHTARVFFGEKIMGADFTHHQGNIWKVDVLTTVPAQGSENRFWIFELGTSEGVIANGTGLPQQRLRTTRLDHFRLIQATSITDVDAANGRYFISGNTLYLRTSDGGPPRVDQEFRIPSQLPNDSVVFGAGPQCEITLSGIEVYFASNGADVSFASRYIANGCKFFGSGGSGLLTQRNSVGIEEYCEYAANANDGCSPVNYGISESRITVIDPWSHDNGDEGHSLHGLCRGFYFGGLYELNAKGGITPAIGSNAVLQSILTRGNEAGICPTVSPEVHVLVSDWTSIGDYDGLENWTSGLATVVDSRILNPSNYGFNAIVGNSRIEVFGTLMVGGIGQSGGASPANTVFSNAPLEIQRKDTPQAKPVNAFGAKHQAPAGGERIAPFLDRSPNGSIVVRTKDPLGVSTVEVAEVFTVGTDHHITINGANSRQLTIEIDELSGWFTGEFSDPAQPAAKRSFTGVIFQSQHYGSGFLQGAGASGDVSISIPFAYSGGAPTPPVFTLNKPDASPNARFANAIAISGSQIVAGACQYGMGGTGPGSAYLYNLKSSTPTLPVATLSDPSPAAGGKFAISVAISGTRLLVGAPVADTETAGGAKACLYDLSQPTPTLVATITNPGPGANGSFGASVAISGIWMVVSAPADDSGTASGGRVYVYAVLGTNPTLIATLNNPSPATNDRFGSAVAMSSTRVVVGTPLDNTGATDAGSVYVYNVISSTPTVPFATLNNPVPAEFDRFGFSVAIFGTRVVVGANGNDTGADDAGSAYVYELSGRTPTLPTFTLNNPHPAAGDRFAHSVAISSSRVVVGASETDSSRHDAGSAYIYELNSSTPTVPSLMLNHPNPAFFDQFGRSVAADGTTIAVGLPFDDTVETERGAVYIFTIGKSILLPAGTSAATEGGVFENIEIGDGATLTLQGPTNTGPLSTGVPSVRLTGIGNARHLAIEYIRSKRSNVIYTVEFGDTPDGASFQQAVNAPIVTRIDDDLEHVIVEDIVTVGDQPLRLGRVRITTP